MADVCVLADGRRIKFSLKRRAGRDPYYLAVFRGLDGSRKERSTQERNEKRAKDAAAVMIRDEYAPREERIQSISWEEAIAEMVRYMNGQKLRPRTVEDYELALKNLRAVFPETKGPAEIDEKLAKQYKLKRVEKGLSAYTVAGNINKLGVIWKKWLIKNCKLLTFNPWEEVEQPKTDKPRPRILTIEEEEHFFDWLAGRWGSWRLPVLFLQVKAAIGCRILELCLARSADLRDGRLNLASETCKGRKDRQSKLPAELYDELKSLAGPIYVWERFSEQLRSVYIARKESHHAAATKEFDPKRFKRWVQKEKEEYLLAHEGDPNVRHFKLHNLRGTAMSRAKQAGATYDQASIAFGCHPETMRKHYLQLDETAIADGVFDKIQSGRTPKSAKANGEQDDG